MKHVFVMASVLILGLIACESKKAKVEQAKSVIEKKMEKQEKAAMEASKPDPDKIGKFEFEHSEYKFDEVNEGDIVEHVFKFTNLGPAPLIIENARGSCGCTVPEYSKGVPIAAGDSGEIRVKFNTKGKPNNQSKFISIFANTDPAVTRLKITGFVKPAKK